MRSTYQLRSVHESPLNAPSLRDAVEYFQSVGMPARNLADRTRQEYSGDLAELLGFCRSRGTYQLADLTLGLLEAFQASLDHRGLAASSRRRKTHSIRSWLRFLHSHRLVAPDLAAGLKSPHAPRREPRFLSEGEYRQLLRSCSHEPRDAAIVELFLQTGMRLSELARLRLSDLELPARPSPDPDNVGTVRVSRKGGRTDTIPLNHKACRALKTWLAVRPQTDGHALFTSKFREGMSKRAIQATVAKYLAQARITGASVHTLRHTMATHHIARGTDLKTIQETLGHADLATTALYVSLAKKAQRRALQENAL